MTDPATVVQALIAAIHAHDVEAICVLMAEDFVFVDSLGRVAKGRTAMRGGWEGYFRLFPDYQISVEDPFVAADRLALLGTAQATLRSAEMLPENRWQVPAAWKAMVRGGQMAEWRVDADNYQTVQMVRGK